MVIVILTMKTVTEPNVVALMKRKTTNAIHDTNDNNDNTESNKKG